MWCPSPSSAWGALSQHLGTGRLHPAGTLRLTMEQRGGAGLIWSLTVADQRCQAWCEEQAWCQWIAPLLSVPSLAAIDPALLTPLALWSWQPLMSCLAEEPEGEAQLQIKPPTTGTLAAAWDPQLILVREDKVQLALRLLDWPAQWLITLSQAWEPLASGSQAPPLAISVIAGWCCVSDHALEKVGLGEGVRLSGAVDLWHGEAWLFQQQPLAKVRFTNAQQAAVEGIMAEQSEWPAERGGSLVQALSITVVAEIGQLWLSLEQLTDLQVGDVLQGKSLFDGTVRLKANGQYLGSGQLIEVGGQWVIQIERWFNQTPLIAPQEVRSEPREEDPPWKAVVEEAKPVAAEAEAAAEAAVEEADPAATLVEEALVERDQPLAVELLSEEATALEGSTAITPGVDQAIGERDEEEESTMKKEEAIAVSALAALQSMVAAVGDSAPVAVSESELESKSVDPPPPIRMPPKPPRPPKGLRTAMNSMAKSVTGRRKPGTPSTV